ncbi:1-acyl-sn-glycerol-3-phosphate acyltransferase [Aromatoleum diolicum]|uniref:1-acyl-sn-glycerol-3-phosphate acyltransferase n=1 Tax=Aromatoleum diolicum TaxID=75796 RepID=A0ABX1QEZ9_9RHOO|nr:lysophospholipid acyltransferase family protein [Aromatoleum diolicum]NMG76070.1 1-acyl-sn-glycerol-3-phosphate acyltransferase [Aromatoleum diolicum]
MTESGHHARPSPVRTLHEYVLLYLGLGYLGTICLLWTPIAMLLHPVLPSGAGRRLGRLFINHGFNAYIRFLTLIGACRFDLAALDSLRGQGPLILAPNHPCLLDAVMVISRLPDVVCIMKAGLMDNIFLGAGARLARYIRNDAPLRMVGRATEDLAAGSFLLVFPEGTRTIRLPVNPLMSSVGLISRRAKVPIQTIFIETASPYLCKGWPLFRKPEMPVTYRVRLGKRFDPPASVQPFMAELERYFAAELAHAVLPDLPVGTDGGASSPNA